MRDGVTLCHSLSMAGPIHRMIPAEALQLIESITLDNENLSLGNKISSLVFFLKINLRQAVLTFTNCGTKPLPEPHMTYLQ